MYACRYQSLKYCGVQAPAIVRTVNLALIPGGATALSMSDAARVLRHAQHLCTLLANQSALVRNSVILRLVLMQHVFLSVIPPPLPLNHPDRKTRCFWAASQVRYETQVRPSPHRLSR